MTSIIPLILGIIGLPILPAFLVFNWIEEQQPHDYLYLSGLMITLLLAFVGLVTYGFAIGGLLVWVGIAEW